MTPSESTSSFSTSQRLLSSLMPYVAPPIAASVAIVPAFYDMIAKSALQKGLPAPNMTFISVFQGIRGGLGAAPTVGVIVGTQMILQNHVEHLFAKIFSNIFAEESGHAKALLTLASSAVIGALSSPFLAVYNGKTMTPPWSIKMSLSKFSSKQAGAITLQETGFVAGLAAADQVSVPMKKIAGDNKATEYLAAGTSGALGSMAGHAGNTALTRWQNGMSIDSFRQLSWGAVRKARGTAVFAVVYKLGKDVLNSKAEAKQSS